MNIQKVRELADYLETQVKDELFNMRSFSTSRDCGTSHCIAGWECVRLGYEIGFSIPDTARKSLELNDKETIFLFYDGYQRTRFDAVKTLRDVADLKESSDEKALSQYMINHTEESAVLYE